MTIAPPHPDAMFDGPQDIEAFLANGQEYLTIYRELAGLTPDETMLDVGSGIGRKTIPLTDYLSPAAHYEGIDVSLAGVDWCRKNITAEFPNFHFQHVDVFAPGYNPCGTILDDEFEFPYDANTFDFVTLGSVFTHMQMPGVRNYLSEVHRVLRVGGRCLITYFLLDQGSLHRIHLDKGACGFPYPHATGRIASLAMPEQAIAFHEAAILHAYTNAGLHISTTRFGTWSGREGLTYQDIVLAERTA